MPAIKKPVPAAAIKLQTYAYECTNNQGKKVKGEISAANISLAKAD